MDWMELRREFAVTEKYAFLDHAAVGPIPRAAADALRRHADEAATEGVLGYAGWAKGVAAARVLAARIVNAPSPDDVAFVPNTTTGIGYVAEGFPWREGDNVVVAAEEYPANRYAWMNLAGRGVEVITVPSRGARVEIDDVAAAITPRTRILSTSFVQFASGFRADLAALGELARSRGLFFFVDAIQGLGAFPLDVQACGVDALSADGHKWMLGPEGAGLFYLRREWVDRLHPIGVGAHSVTDPYNYAKVAFDLWPHARRYEGGAWNVPGILAFGESLRLLLEAGPENTARRVLALTDELCEAAARRGWEVFSSRRPGDASGIVSLARPGVDPVAVMKRCRDAGVVVNARGGRVRVSPHGYNTPAELHRFLDAAG